ncbi:hypothetical protein [Janthinobacterium sp. LB2P70]|uniref:hypothetical protein n=1 Tax=Janthinobacterium sp. LB2P70 TaxID=3424197 RepID=UPI003F1EA618
MTNEAIAYGNRVIYDHNKLPHAISKNESMLQAIPDYRAGTYHYTQAANLRDGVEMVATDFVIGKALGGIAAGGRYIYDGLVIGAKSMAPAIGEAVFKYAERTGLISYAAENTGASSVKVGGFSQGTNKIVTSDAKLIPDYIATSNGDIGSTLGLGPRKLTALERELQVAEITGGRSAQTSRIGPNGNLVIEDTPIYRDGQVVSGVDVFGKNGELIQVGGPGKNANDVVFERTKKALEALKSEAKARGTTAQVYYEAGNSERFNNLILESKKILGKNNVFILPKKDL